MEQLIIPVLALIILTFLVKFVPKKTTLARLPYKKKDYFFSIAEKNFYHILLTATKDLDIIIFSKVRIPDIIYIPKGTKDSIVYWNKIKSKHVDFLICDKKQIKPLCIIELDDSSHNRPDRRERDQYLNKAFREAGLPILHIPVSAAYNIQTIREAIMPHLPKQN